jgi:hypothetical protein
LGRQTCCEDAISIPGRLPRRCNLSGDPGEPSAYQTPGITGLGMYHVGTALAYHCCSPLAVLTRGRSGPRSCWLTRVLAHARAGSHAYWPTRVLAHAVGRGTGTGLACDGGQRAPNSGPQRIRSSPACPRLFAPTASRGRGPIDHKAQARTNPKGGPGSANKLGRRRRTKRGEPMAGKGGDHEVAKAQEGAEA